jgi:hypothetical protein
MVVFLPVNSFEASVLYPLAQTIVMVDFRLIPLGDIDLQHEIRLGMDAAIVERRRERRCVRRVYSAKLEGRSSGMTVALYQGNNAEEVCVRALSLFCQFSVALIGMAICRLPTFLPSVPPQKCSLCFTLIAVDCRHPNIVQLYGVVNSPGIHAAVYHDGTSFVSTPNNRLHVLNN